MNKFNQIFIGINKLIWFARHHFRKLLFSWNLSFKFFILNCHKKVKLEQKNRKWRLNFLSVKKKFNYLHPVEMHSCFYEQQASFFFHRGLKCPLPYLITRNFHAMHLKDGMSAMNSRASGNTCTHPILCAAY